jgi:hypothetical protein
MLKLGVIEKVNATAIMGRDFHGLTWNGTGMRQQEVSAMPVHLSTRLRAPPALLTFHGMINKPILTTVNNTQLTPRPTVSYILSMSLVGTSTTNCNCNVI